MTVCFELKKTPLEVQDMFFDDIDYLGIVKYYDKIVEDNNKLEAAKTKAAPNG